MQERIGISLGLIFVENVWKKEKCAKRIGLSCWVIFIVKKGVDYFLGVLDKYLTLGKGVGLFIEVAG